MKKQLQILILVAFIILITGCGSTISFTWNASSNTDGYQLVLKNLLSGTITKNTTTQTNLAITLPRNTPFSWYVISTSLKNPATTQSDVWKFYNAGAGIVSYAPFPATITSPTFGQAVTAASGTISLAWTGNSVTGGTIANYDVYFGTTNNPPLLMGNITTTSLNNVAVSHQTTYYWKVITRDILGNTSDSGLYQFSVN
jgi:hypothetical protein